LPVTRLAAVGLAGAEKSRCRNIAGKRGNWDRADQISPFFGQILRAGINRAASPDAGERVRKEKIHRRAYTIETVGFVSARGTMRGISVGPVGRLGRASGKSSIHPATRRFPESAKTARFYVIADPIAGRFLGAAAQRAEFDSGFVAFLLGRTRPRS
jgi:hypothetical protein